MRYGFMNIARPDLMKEICGRINPQQHVFLATIEGTQPRVRLVTLLHFQRRLYVVTGSKNAKMTQIKKNPKVEFCLLLEKGEDTGALRAECLAKVVEDKKLKADVFDEVSFVKEFFKGPEDSGYALVWLKPVVFEFMRPGEIQAVKVKL